MNSFKKYIKPSLFITCLWLSSNNLYAEAPFQHTFLLKSKVAHLNSSIPIKISCSMCTQITKQDDYTYHITYNAPANNSDSMNNTITFTYWYGDEQNNCIYHANVPFGLLKSGEVFHTAYLPSSELDAKSTSNACPPKVPVFVDGKFGAKQTILHMDW